MYIQPNSQSQFLNGFYFFYYMKYLQKWTGNNCKLISLALKDLICSLYFKIVLILLLFEAGDIEINPGPNIINNSLSILHSNIRSIRNKLDCITEIFFRF